MNKLSFSQIIKLMNGKGANVSVDFQLPDDHRTVWIIDWAENEKGWGYSEPDGHSLHTKKQSLVDYFNQYARTDDNEYSNYPTGFYLEKVPQNIYNNVVNKGGTLTIFYKNW